MSSDDFPITEEGDNWTVVVFRCPRKSWTEILKNLFSELDKQKLSLTPHYSIRAFEQPTDSFIISFRILRKQKHEQAIKSLIERFMKGYDYEIGDPKAETLFPNCHQWIRQGAKDAKWNKERCEILSKISRFVLEIIKSDTSRDDKEEWTHEFSLMAGVFDLFKIYHSPETVLSPDTTPYRVLRYG